MFERFTERARRTLVLAKEEAQRTCAQLVEPEHVLLGLLREGTGVGARVLKDLGVDIRSMRLELEQLAKSSHWQAECAEPLIPSDRAKKAIEFAVTEARDLAHNYVGTEHLLLGLMRNPEGVIKEVLARLGLLANGIRAETLRLYRAPPKNDAADPTVWLGDGI